MSKKETKKNPNPLLKYLEKKGIKPNVLAHRTAYTAIDAANTLKRKMDETVKSLLVKADQFYYIVCLPANQNLDFKKIKKAIESVAGVRVKTVQIPNEKVMAKILKLKNEGLTAFGGLYELPVVVEKKLANIKKAIFSSGSFNHSVEMAAKDFVKLENAILASIGINKKIKVISRPSKSLIGKSANKKMAKKKKAAKKATKKSKKSKK